MRRMWCWRCRVEVAMLDDEEFDRFARAWSDCKEHTRRQARAKRDRPSLFSRLAEGVFARRARPAKTGLRERFQPALDVYQQITGTIETNPNAVWHHVISLYGPDCSACGKPLRSPAASYCAACGERRRTRGGATR